MYVDESGDCGLPSNHSPTNYFILTGFVVHELRWKETLEKLIFFRKSIREKFNFPVRDEIHASLFLNGHNDKLIKKVKRNDRLAILKSFILEIASLNEVSVINIVIDKRDKDEKFEIFNTAWRTLLQRFENTISKRNFPGPTNSDDMGLLFPDHTDDKKLRLLVRKMRKINMIPNQQKYGQGYRNQPLVKLIEDPNMRNSEDSYFIQAVDTIAYFLKQYLEPSTYLRKKGGHKYFEKLEPVLCKQATSGDPLGIVRL